MDESIMSTINVIYEAFSGFQLIIITLLLISLIAILGRKKFISYLLLVPNIHPVFDKIIQMLLFILSLNKVTESSWNNEISSDLDNAKSFRLKGSHNETKRLYQEIIEKVHSMIDKGMVTSSEDKLVCAQAFLDSGHDHQNRGEFRDALSFYQQSKELADGNDNQSQLYTARANSASGFIHHIQGNEDQAKFEFNSAKQTFERINEYLGVAGAWKGLARIHYVAGQYEDALSSYEKSMAEYSKANDNFGKSQVNLGIGAIYLSQGLSEKAEVKFTEAYNGFKTDNNTRGLASTFFNFALLHQYRHNISDSFSELETAKVFFSFIESKLEKANAYLVLGQSLTEAAAYLDAERALERANRLYSNMEVSLGLTNIKLARGNLKLKTNDHQTARHYYDEVLVACPQNHTRAITLSNLGSSYFITGKYAEAQECYEKSLNVYGELNSTKDELKLYLKLGYLEIIQNNFAQASVNFDKASAKLKPSNRKQRSNVSLYKALNILEEVTYLKQPLCTNKTEQFQKLMTEAGEDSYKPFVKYLNGRLSILQNKHFYARELLLEARTLFDSANEYTWMVRCNYSLGLNEWEGLKNTDMPNAAENSRFFLNKGKKKAEEIQLKIAINAINELVKEINTSQGILE